MNLLFTWLFILLGFLSILIPGKITDRPKILFRVRLICIGVVSALLPQQIEAILGIPIVFAFVINLLVLWGALQLVSMTKH